MVKQLPSGVSPFNYNYILGSQGGGREKRLSIFLISLLLRFCLSLFLFSALDLKNAPGSVYEGPPKGDKPGCTLTLSDDDFMGFVSGSLNPQKVSLSTTLL